MAEKDVLIEIEEVIEKSADLAIKTQNYTELAQHVAAVYAIILGMCKGALAQRKE